jgi:glycosyltransferase involved in cell wall biosynthesis
LARRPPRPRILIILENESVPGDRRVWDECRTLAEAGYGVSIICRRPPGEPAYEERDGVVIHRYAEPPAARGRLGFAYEFAYSWVRTTALSVRLLAGEGFDAIQACNPPDTYFALAWPFKLLGKPFVFDHHDLSPELYEGRFGAGGLLHRGLRLLERATFRTADHVIATNDSYRDVALARGRKRPEQVTVVRNGPDMRRMRPHAPNPALRHGRDLLCCYVGVMEPQDGVDLALRAAHHVVHELDRHDCHFAFLGDGHSLPQLRRLAHELELDDYVTFTGWARDDVLIDYLSTADLGLQPDPKDPHTDVSTMVKTVEYMGFELPVVAFDLAETRASAGDAAVYATPNEVADFARLVDELLDDPARRAEMGAIGGRRVRERLAWDHQKLAYLGVWARLLGPPRPSGRVAVQQLADEPARQRR